MLGEGWINVECQNLYVFGDGRIDFETIKWVDFFWPTTLRMIPFLKPPTNWSIIYDF